MVDMADWATEAEVKLMLSTDRDVVVMLSRVMLSWL